MMDISFGQQRNQKIMFLGIIITTIITIIIIIIYYYYYHIRDYGFDPLSLYKVRAKKDMQTAEIKNGR
jgi:predicted secreted protein